MTDFPRGYLIITGDGVLVAADWRSEVGAPEVAIEAAALNLPEGGTYWVIIQDVLNGRNICRLIRIELERDEEQSMLTEQPYRIDTRVLLDDSYSERFRVSQAKMLRSGLSSKGVPGPVIDAYVLGQTSPFAEHIVL